VLGDKRAVVVRACVDLCGELELEEKKVGVGIFGMRPEGIDMDGKALDNLFSALSPAD
jgi:hypothetical protein